MISPVCQPAQVEVKAILRVASFATAHDPPHRIEHPGDLECSVERLCYEGEKSGSCAGEDDSAAAIDMTEYASRSSA